MSEFRPSHAWQDVPLGAVLPPGLEIEMDMTTGRQRARIPPSAAQAEQAREALIRAFAEQRKPRAPDISAGRLDWTKLAGQLPPEREWVWRDQIPARTVTLLHGAGGIGKSTLLQQLATSAALGRALLGGEPLAQYKVLAWFGEDDRDEIWRRQTAINRTLGIADPAEALSKALRPNGPNGPADPTGLLPLVGKAEFHALPGEDITLFLAKNEGDYTEGPALPILRKQIGDFRPGLVLLDSVAKIYGGPENNRQLVTRCVQRLIQLCIEFGTTILLNGHDNKAGEYSGTTAWENTVRSRLHFKREAELDDNGKPIKGGDSHNVLIRPKTNYAAPDDLGIAMRWFGGALISLNPDHATPEMQAAMRQAEAEADQAFIEALRQLTTRQVTTSDASTSTYYAPKQILKHSLASNLSQRDLAKAMRRLIMSGAIARGELPWKTKHRTPAVGITLVTHKL